MNSGERFTLSVVANIAHWRRKTHVLDESAFRALKVDWPNIVRAVEFGLALPELWVHTTELSLQMFEFVERLTYWREWIRILELVIAANNTHPSRLHCKLLDHLGHLRRLNWQLPAALEAHRAAEALALEAGDEDELAHAHFSLSEDYRYSRNYEEAERFGQSALEIFIRLKASDAQIAAVFNTLGLISHARGDFEVAEQRFRHAIELYYRIDRPTDLARALKNLALALEAGGKVSQALQHYAEAKAILDRTTSELDKVLVDLSVGTLYFNQGQLAEAEAAFRRADSLYLRQSGITYYQALTANNLGNVLLAQGRLAEAEAQLRHSLSLWRGTSDEVMLANTLGTLGEALVKQGESGSAIPIYDEALQLLARYQGDAWAQHLLAKFTAQRRELGTAD